MPAGYRLLVTQFTVRCCTRERRKGGGRGRNRKGYLLPTGYRQCRDSSLQFPRGKKKETSSGEEGKEWGGMNATRNVTSIRPGRVVVVFRGGCSVLNEPNFTVNARRVAAVRVAGQIKGHAIRLYVFHDSVPVECVARLVVGAT